MPYRISFGANTASRVSGAESPQAEVISLSGIQMLSFRGNSASVAALPDGIYPVSVNDADTTVTRKVLKHLERTQSFTSSKD